MKKPVSDYFPINTQYSRWLIMFSVSNQNDEVNGEFDTVAQVSLLEAVIESFVDGILILTTEYELVHTNEYARRICRELNSNKTNSVPEEILHICESLVDSRELLPDEKVFMEYEIEKSPTVKLRIKARWLTMEDECILVTIEDCYLSNQNSAIADARKYGLTEREAQVWLLRRANLSYREIAQNLYITINTVKKHLKNIYAKQQDMMCLGS
jgi:DNA-binding CsgD family transcriptional regulator